MAAPRAAVAARFIVGLLIACGVLTIGLIATVMFGRVTGEEFNPYSFERRSFWFFELPLVRIQVWPLQRDDAQGKLEEYLLRNQYVTALKPPQADTWDLFNIARHNATYPPTDATILQRYLDATTPDYEPYWASWSDEHPKLAQVVWPEVIDAARAGLYVFIPEIFSAAETADDAPKLQQELTKHLTRRAEEYARRAAERGEFARAKRILDYALTKSPEDASLKKLGEMIAAGEKEAEVRRSEGKQ